MSLSFPFTSTGWINRFEIIIIIIIIIIKLTKLFFHFRDPVDSDGGQIIFGGSDEALYEGELNWIDLSSATYWQISVSGYKHNLYLHKL